MKTPTVLISHIYKARQTLIALLEKQGYDVSDYDHFSISEINAMNQSKQLDMLLEEKTKSSLKRKIYVHHFLGPKLAVRAIQQIIEDLFVLSETLEYKDTLMIIVKNDPNDTIKNELKHLWESEGLFVIVENIKRLQFNILNHKYVPPHEIVPEEEVKAVMDRFNITNLCEFPDISRFDPVAKAIGLRPKQLCRILRPCKTSIESNYYRICTNN